MNNNRQNSSDKDMMRDMEDDRVRARLLALEREALTLRARSRIYGAGLAVALILALLAILNPRLLLLGGSEMHMDVIRAREIVLEDANGMKRGGWRVDEDGNARLTMQDRRDQVRLSFSVLNGGSPGLSLTNAGGQARVALGLGLDESATLVFADEAGIPRTVLGLSQADAAHLVFADGEGRNRVALGLDASGEGSVILPDDTQVDTLTNGGS